MPKVLLRKSELRRQRDMLATYQAALPPLDLKRRQLAMELARAQKDAAAAQGTLGELIRAAGEDLPMLAGADGGFKGLVRVESVRLDTQNVAGVSLPVAGEVQFAAAPFSYLASPPWVDELEARLKQAARARIILEVARRRLSLLERAARKVAQRVNLFERVLIPQVKESIRRIQIALGDLEREAVIRSKLSKARHQTVPLIEDEIPA